MAGVNVDDLQEGEMYRFVYKQQSGNFQWYTWTCVAVHLFRRKEDYIDEVVVSFRPYGGTSSLTTAHITQIDQLAEVQPKLPTRVPGAVPAPAGA